MNTAIMVPTIEELLDLPPASPFRRQQQTVNMKKVLIVYSYFGLSNASFSDKISPKAM
jgi:hypothetical protein